MTTCTLLRGLLALLGLLLYVVGCLDIGTRAGWSDPLTGRGILAFTGATLVTVLVGSALERRLRQRPEALHGH